MLWYPVGFDRRLPGPAAVRGRAAAPLGRVHAAGLRRGAAGVDRRAHARRRARRADRLALPGAAVPGRRAGAARRSPARPYWVGAAAGRPWSSPSTCARRHAAHHVRAGLPVLAQAHRARRSRLVFLLLALAGRGARPAAALDGRRPLADAADRRRRGHPLLLDLLADPGDVPGHHGAAARAGPLLHQPGRPGRPPHDAGGARRCSALFYLLPDVYGVLGRVYAPAPAGDRPHGRGGAAAARAALLGGTLGAAARRRWSAAGAFAAFLSTSSGLLVSVAGVLVHGRARRGAAAGAVRDFRLAAVAGACGAAACCRLRAPDARVVARGRPGVRGGGLHVLPAAGARHLVARADRRRRRRRAARRRRRWPAPRCWSRSLAARRAGWPARCWPSRPRGPCRSAFAVMVGVSLATRRRVPGRRRAGRWCGCTPPRRSRLHRVTARSPDGDRRHCGAAPRAARRTPPARSPARQPQWLSYGRRSRSCHCRRRRRSTVVLVTSSEIRPEPNEGGSPGGVRPDGRRPPRFVDLRRRFRNFVFPMTVAFLAWYLLYVVLSAFARDFMDTKVVGNINVASSSGCCSSSPRSSSPGPTRGSPNRGSTRSRASCAGAAGHRSESVGGTR